MKLSSDVLSLRETRLKLCRFTKIPNIFWTTLDLNQATAGKTLVRGRLPGKATTTAQPARLGHAWVRRGAWRVNQGSPINQVAVTCDRALGYENVKRNSTSVGGTCSE